MYTDSGNEIEETSDTIGDASFVTTFTDTDPDSRADISAVVVAFRYEHQIARVNVSDYETLLPDSKPTVEETEALAERLFARIETVREEGSTGLEHLMLWLESDGELAYYNADDYTRIDDEPLPRSGQDDDLLEASDDAERSLGITDAHRLVQTVGNTGETYIKFDDEDGAADWVDSAEEWLETFARGRHQRHELPE